MHSLFWLGWIVSFTLIQSIGEGYREAFVWLMYYLITLPVFVAHTYLIAYYLVPDFFLKRKFWGFSLSILLLLIVFSIIELIVSNEVVFKLFSPEKMFAPHYLSIQNIVISGLGNHFIILVFLAIKAVKSWHESKSRKEELVQQNLETELEIYKYHLQPSIILTLVNEIELLGNQNSKRYPEIIVKVSDFINKLLFEAKSELIPLATEVGLIQDFMSIQELALGNRFKTKVIVNGNVQTKVVPPLLIFPFLNSALKVAINSNFLYESTVIIKVERKYLLFSFTLWSENEFQFLVDGNTELTQKRLFYNYNGKHRIIENDDVNFKEISIEIFT